MSTRAAVLVVEHDRDARSRIGRWLAEADYDVIECPGPSAPDFTCVGSRGGRCALAMDADVVVLNLRQASDEFMVGSPGYELLFYYTARGKRVVVVAGDQDAMVPFPSADVAVVRRPVQRDALLDAVGWMTVGPRRGVPL